MSESSLSDQIVVEAQTRNLAKVREFLHRAIKRSALPSADVNKVVLAVDEAVANTIQHGYDGVEGGRVEILIEADQEQFKVTVRDSGIAYDAAKGADETAELDLQAHVSAGNKRGLGLFIMRKVMDEVLYHSREGELNELILVKYIAPRGDS